MLLRFLPSLSLLIWYLLLNFQICHQSLSSITICLWQFYWDQLGWVQKLMGVLHYPLQQSSVAVRTLNYVKNPSNSFFNQYPQKNRIVWRQWKILFLAGWSADVYLFQFLEFGEFCWSLIWICVCAEFGCVHCRSRLWQCCAINCSQRVIFHGICIQWCSTELWSWLLSSAPVATSLPWYPSRVSS